MARLITLALLLLSLTVQADVKRLDGSESSPTPQGDTKMGADAATSGTDLEDRSLQEQEEEKIESNGESSPHIKEELEKEQNKIKSN